MERMIGYNCNEVIFCAREIEDLLDLFLSMKFILSNHPNEHHACYLKWLDHDVAINAHQEFDSSTALKFIEDQKVKDEELQDKVANRMLIIYAFTKLDFVIAQHGSNMQGPCRCCTPLM